MCPGAAPHQVLTGELEPTSGAVWMHPNTRIAYVAQHAFHHIEQHLEKTPNEYIRWRYAIGEDRENLTKVTRQVHQRCSLILLRCSELLGAALRHAPSSCCATGSTADSINQM